MREADQLRIGHVAGERDGRGILPSRSGLLGSKLLFAVVLPVTTLATATPVFAQRLLGLDVSAYQTDITQTEWDTFKRPTNQQISGVFGDGRDFVIIRSSRGGTTGEDHRQGGYPSGNNTFYNQSERYDDPYFVQNITRATTAGLFAGAYHFARPDVIVGTVNSDGSTVSVANTGTDEANHFIQMAGPWMRPGYMPPMYDFEAGQSQRSATEMAQFSLDFSDRIYQVMGIRPSIYTNGSYAGTLAGGTAAQRSALAQLPSNVPSVVSPAYPTLVSARWPNQSNPGAIDVQNAHPKDSYTPIYGPWDDYGVTQPWSFWQYASTMKLNGNNGGTSNTDVDVSQGDVEWVKDHLIPAVWMNDNSGDWSTLANWNSGQAAVAPPQMSGQLTPLATGPLPDARLPGVAGTGPAVTSGLNDTVILERPNANITVTLSNGSSNIRKLYVREALNITGGTLTINYDPNYVSDTVNYPNALRSGPISAQFSGPISLSGSGNLSVNTLQVDAAQTFTLAGSSGALTFKTINLMPDSSTPAKILLAGDVNINPLSNATATIANGAGAGNSGFVDLSSGTRAFNVGNGTSDVDLAVNVPISSGALTKNGLGTMQLGGANTFSGGVTVNDGILRVTANNQLGTTGVTTNMTVVTPGSAGSGHGGTVQLSGNVSYNLPLTINGGGVNGVSLTAPGSTGALDNFSGDNTWSGTITLAGTGANGSDPLENQIGAQGGVLRLTGIMQNGGGVTATWAKTGDGDVVLGGAAANTYTGLTRVFGGRLVIEKDGALGAAGSMNSSTSNTFQNTGSASTIAFRAPTGSGGLNYNTFEVINTNGTGAPGYGQIDNLGGNNTFDGQIAFDGPTVGASRQASIGVSSGSLNVTGGLYARGNDGSPRNLTKLGAGTLIVSGDGGAATGNSLVVPLVNSTMNVIAGTVEMRGPTLTAANLPGVTTWNVASGATLLASSGRFSTGTVNVSASGQFNLTGGSTDVATIDLSGGGTFGFTGGTLHAQTIQGNVTNQGGTLSPGNSPGVTAIGGNYVQQNGGKLDVEIGGPGSGSGFDAVNITGNALLGGELDVSLINGFSPTPGQMFNVLTAGSVTYNGLSLGGAAGSSFYLMVGPSSLTLQAAGYPGDFNFDGTVDGADYVSWRKGPGYLPGYYDLWRAHLGESGGRGSGILGGVPSVPEPTAVGMIIFAVATLMCRRRFPQR
jgi:autotransporter-associated beta strand protein